jgi:hypothetical protein
MQVDRYQISVEVEGLAPRPQHLPGALWPQVQLPDLAQVVQVIVNPLHCLLVRQIELRPDELRDQWERRVARRVAGCQLEQLPAKCLAFGSDLLLIQLVRRTAELLADLERQPPGRPRRRQQQTEIGLPVSPISPAPEIRSTVDPISRETLSGTRSQAKHPARHDGCVRPD